MRLLLTLAATLALAACSPSAAQNDTWSPIALTVTPFTMPEQVGELTFRAGFVLDSPQARFGGLSDLHVFDDGRLLAITDSGEWFLAELIVDPVTGLPMGLANPRMALMRNEAGEPFPNKQTGDSEDLAVLPDGRIAVSFEQTQSIRIYDLFGAGPMAPSQPGPALAGTDRLGPNRGLEALAVLPNGDLLIGAERGSRAGASPVWRAPLSGTAPVASAHRIRPPFGYGLTAWDATPEGRILLTQRFYAPGLGTRIRVLEAALEDPEPDLGFTELAILAAPLEVDNVEGLAVQPLPDGPSGPALRIYLITDDNFSDSQRTLLFVFDLEGQPAVARVAR